MKRLFCLLLLVLATSFFAHSQLAVLKMVGKNSDQYNIGFGLFCNYDIPINEIGNKSVMIELMDISFFPVKSSSDLHGRGYISVKLGFRNIFSAESKTGFYIEPQVGYCRVAEGDEALGYGDGFAAAMEAGYSLEVGERGNSMLFGLKYEADMAGSDHTIQAIGFRVAYSFSFLRKKRE